MSSSENNDPPRPIPGLNFPGAIVPQLQQEAEVGGLDGVAVRLNQWILTGGLTKMMNENCMIKGTMSLVIGGGGGIALGCFMAPFDSYNGLKVAENATARETAVATFRQTANKAGSMGRMFATIGGVYATTECVIEKYRARTDLYNSLYGGCLAGGIIARNAGPSGMMAGCAGFAAWSVAIDSFMHGGGSETLFGK